MKKTQVLQILKAHREELTQRGVRSLALFGSVARGEETPQSDVDLLVDFEAAPSLFELATLRQRLEMLLGARVDLVPRDGLKECFRQQVIDESIDAA